MGWLFGKKNDGLYRGDAPATAPGYDSAEPTAYTGTVGAAPYTGASTVSANPYPTASAPYPTATTPFPTAPFATTPFPTAPSQYPGAPTATSGFSYPAGGTPYSSAGQRPTGQQPYVQPGSTPSLGQIFGASGTGMSADGVQQELAAALRFAQNQQRVVTRAVTRSIFGSLLPMLLIGGLVAVGYFVVGKVQDGIDNPFRSSGSAPGTAGPDRSRLDRRVARRRGARSHARRRGCCPMRQLDPGAVAVWLRRLGLAVPFGEALPEPYATQLAEDWRAAATMWTELGCRYEAALSLADSTDETALREALRDLDELGATATARLIRARMRHLGLTAVPAGPQTWTRSHQFGLTRRQQEILDLLCASMTNAEISQRLFISEKTVDHHVSAVLNKMGVRSRGAAARVAVRLGLVTAEPRQAG